MVSRRPGPLFPMKQHYIPEPRYGQCNGCGSLTERILDLLQSHGQNRIGYHLPH